MTTVATPTFSPVAGNYGAPQTVTISCVTPSSTIFYTTDGTTPTEIGGVPQGTALTYTVPVAVSISETLKAIGYVLGDTDSAVGSAAYTLTVPASTFSPIAGLYAGPTVSITILNTQHTLTGFQIYFTLDGSTPTTGSTPYTYGNSIQITSGKTLKVLAIATGWTNAAVVSATYYVLAISAISPESVVFDEAGQVLQLTGGVVSGGITDVTDWSSSNTAAVTITAHTGSLTAVAPGTATITAASDEVDTLSVSIIVIVGALVIADITHLQTGLIQLIQGISSSNSFEAAQQTKLQTALLHLQQNSLTTADLELIQSFLNDQYQQLATAGPYQAGQLAAVKQALADVRALL